MVNNGDLSIPAARAYKTGRNVTAPRLPIGLSDQGTFLVYHAPIKSYTLFSIALNGGMWISAARRRLIQIMM